MKVVMMRQMSLDNRLTRVRKIMIRIKLAEQSRKFIPKARRCITKRAVTGQ